MNRNLPELQRQLLQRAAGEPITDASAVDAKASNALIKRWLVILLPADDAGGRLIVTAAGLAALPEQAPRRPSRRLQAMAKASPARTRRPSTCGRRKANQSAGSRALRNHQIRRPPRGRCACRRASSACSWPSCGVPKARASRT
jgi:hypothetical protein